MSSKRVPAGPEKGKTKYDLSQLPDLICSACERSDLPLEQFVANRRRIVGYRLPLVCLECDKEAVLARRRKNKQDQRDRNPNEVRQKYRDWQLQSTYNITQARYIEILEEQGNVCAICRKKNTAEKDYHIDHDHACCDGNRSCGACVRGLLCNRCNLMLGLSKDSVETLRSAVLYLEGRNS